MVRGFRMREKAVPLAAGALAGALFATMISGGAARATGAGAQDPGVQMQIQQALSNFQVQNQTQMNMMASRIDILEREQQNLRMQMTNAAIERSRPELPTPADPIPGVATHGRIVSLSAESERFVLRAPRGDLLAQLAATNEGPGLVLFDATGRIAAALIATPEGAQLRLAGADGTLQTVLSGQ